jgi:hypothetical protein
MLYCPLVLQTTAWPLLGQQLLGLQDMGLQSSAHVVLTH